jgi:hypothetical protein
MTPRMDKQTELISKVKRALLRLGLGNLFCFFLFPPSSTQHPYLQRDACERTFAAQDASFAHAHSLSLSHVLYYMSITVVGYGKQR